LAASLLNALFANLPDWVVYKDRQGVYQFCNLAFAELTRYTCTEIVGRRDRDLALPPDLQQILGNGDIVEPCQFEQPISGPNQQQRWFQIQITPIKDEALDGVMFRGQDITVAKRSETEKEAEIKLLKSIYDGAEMPIFAVDVVGENAFEFVSFNHVAERNMNVQPGELVGQSPGEAVAKKYRHCYQQGSPLTYEEYLKFKNQDSWWLTTLNPLQDSAGQIYRIVGTTVEITDRHLAEISLQQKATELTAALADLQETQAQLVQSERMSSLGQLVAGIAHEINNPISFITGNIEHIRQYIQELTQVIRLYQAQYPNPNPEIDPYLQEIEFDFVLDDLGSLLNSLSNGADRIRKIVASLRSFSRLDEVGMKNVDLHQGLDNTLMILQNRLKGNTHRADIQVIQNYGSLPPVHCYPGQLNQVFLNILTNAIDAIEGKFNHHLSQYPSFQSSSMPTIQIQTQVTDAGSVCIAISDNGPGMTSVIRSRLFDPFFTTKPVGEGTGMGLAIAYQIVVQQHGGSLTSASKPDGGTVFCIELQVQ
jgi:two-component system NtrC family sensor kinase